MAACMFSQYFTVQTVNCKTCFNCNFWQFITFIIIHSKYFPDPKSTCIIHNNQLLMTKFGRILRLINRWCQSAASLQVNAPLTETWGRGWVVLVVKTKMAEILLASRVRTRQIIAKNMARTARRQLKGRHLLFGEYLRSWTTLNVHHRRWT